MFTGDLVGRWWLPGHDDMVAGTLHSAWDARPKVSGIGLLESARPETIFRHFGGQIVRHPIVLGRIVDGRPVTLENVDVALLQVHLETPEDASIELQAQRAYLGIHFGDQPPLFGGAEVKTEYLLDFLGRNAIPEEWTYEDGRLVGSRLTAARDTETVVAFSGGTLRLGLDVSTTGDRWRERGVVRTARALFALDEAVPAEEWLKLYAIPLTTLVSLATCEDTVMEHVTLLRPDGEPDDTRVELLWRGRAPATRRDRTLLPDERLFSAADPLVPLEQIFTSWLRAWKDLRPVLELFLATRRRSGLYEEHRLLNLTQALEAFHRVRVGGHPLDPAAHNRRVERVLATVSAEDSKWAKHPLKKLANEFTLADRLAALVSGHPWLIGDVAKPTAHKFADEVALTRNYHTHWDELRGAGAATGVDLWPMNERLTVLMEACLLQELGFPEDAIRESIQRASGSYRALKLNGL